MIELEEMLAAGIDDCGLPLAECPGPPQPRPWGAGRPCSRETAGTALGLASGGMGSKRTTSQESWGRDGKYSSPKAHEPTREQQVTIRSKANQEARA